MKTIRSQLTIVDNFLKPEKFQYLKALTENHNPIKNPINPIFWVLAEKVSGSDVTDENNTQLVHSFTDMDTMHILQEVDLFDRLGVIYLIRAKMNLQFKTKNNIVSGMHYDIASVELQEGLTDVDLYTGCGIKTAVLYINDCNGGTQFEDGTFIQSKANRLVEFPRELKHSGVTATDTPTRTVLNLNYLPTNTFPAYGKNRFK